jgi:hypothetical protein
MDEGFLELIAPLMNQAQLHGLGPSGECHG